MVRHVQGRAPRGGLTAPSAASTDYSQVSTLALWPAPVNFCVLATGGLHKTVETRLTETELVYREIICEARLSILKLSEFNYLGGVHRREDAR